MLRKDYFLELTLTKQIRKCLTQDQVLYVWDVRDVLSRVQGAVCAIPCVLGVYVTLLCFFKYKYPFPPSRILICESLRNKYLRLASKRTLLVF